MNTKAHTVFVIAGPTAVGKTAISIQLAQHLNTSIISADSRQCYKEMSIGTAKPSTEELAAAQHYFINSHSIADHITAADYEELALDYLKQIFHHNDYAVVCGGTGLYIKALCEGIDDMPEVNKTIKEEIKLNYEQHGTTWLQDAIQKEDPLFYNSGEIQNPIRLIRALSFIRSTGKSITTFQTGKKKERPFRIVKVALDLRRELLYERINKRVDIMMQEGLMDEVKRLYPYKELKNLHTVGYSELFDYLDNKYTLEEAVDKIKQHSRNYAKRQLTWFRKDEEYNWLRADDKEVLQKILALK